MSQDRDAFLAARDLLLALRDDHDAAVARFHWPRLTHFNWALDHFDRLAQGNEGPVETASDVSSHAGLGISGRVGERELRLGRSTFALSAQHAAQYASLGDDAVLLADDTGLIAAFRLKERLRSGA